MRLLWSTGGMSINDVVVPLLGYGGGGTVQKSTSFLMQRSGVITRNRTYVLLATHCLLYMYRPWYGHSNKPWPECFRLHLSRSGVAVVPQKILITSPNAHTSTLNTTPTPDIVTRPMG